MNMSILAQELEPLNAQIDDLKGSIAKLEGKLRGVEAELETYAIDQQQFAILQDACNALDRLQELGAGALFWEGLPGGTAAAEHSDRLRSRIAGFKAQTVGLEEQQEKLRQLIDRQLDDLDYLFDEVQQAYAREERRQEEFVIEREISFIPYQPMLMPWSKHAESERRFRKALLVAMFWSLALGVLIPLITVPLPDRTRVINEIPERIAMLVKEAVPIPPPAPEPVREKKKEIEPDKSKPADEKKPAVAKSASEKNAPKPAGGGTKLARKKAESTGVLAFKSSFSDLMDEVPVAKLGSEARLNKVDKRVPGQARAQRSLVAIQGSGGSGGIANYGVSRDLGNGGKGGGSGYGIAGQIGGVGVAKVQSNLADLTAEAGRPVSDGAGAGRTDEEIQIIFDRYKATLYRIYNRELRKDPTLRGKLLLRIRIDPNGEVSLCKVESTDLGSQELVAKIVARVEKFNFGPKDDVPQITILYPIDFLPAG